MKVLIVLIFIKKRMRFEEKDRESSFSGCSQQEKRLEPHEIAAKCDPVAQSVEHLTFNQVVAGSIPARITTFLGQ